MTIQSEDRAARAKFIERAHQLFETKLRDQLIKDHERSVVLIDGRSGDYEIQSMYEPRFRATERLLARQPSAVIVPEHIVPEDFAYDVPSTVALLPSVKQLRPSKYGYVTIDPRIRD